MLNVWPTLGVLRNREPHMQVTQIETIVSARLRIPLGRSFESEKTTLILYDAQVRKKSCQAIRRLGLMQLRALEYLRVFMTGRSVVSSTSTLRNGVVVPAPACSRILRFGNCNGCRIMAILASRG